MRLFSTWTGVLAVAILGLAMLAVAAIQHAQGKPPTAVISAAGLGLVAILLARRVMRRSKTVQVPVPEPAPLPSQAPEAKPARRRMSGPGN